MTGAGQLEFTWTTWSVAGSIAATLAAAAFAGLAWRRSGYRPAIAWLELFRVVIVLFAALLLNQPEWVRAERADAKETIVVLCDRSRSMETRDVAAGDSPAALPATRREAAAPIMNPAFWSPLGPRVEVVMHAFPADAATAGTNLHQPLLEAATERNVRGVVIISDGDWNDGAPPADAAARLRLHGVPIFAVSVGSPVRLPDIEIAAFDLPSFGVAGKSVRIPIAVESSLPREYALQAVLRDSQGRETNQEIRIAPMSRTADSIVWHPPAAGDYTLTLELPPHPDETIVENNVMTAPISVREERLHVLLVESYPRWEYRYLRNALSRDPGVELSCLLFHPGLSKTGGGTSDYIEAFPAGLDELSRYDVVFLGDVGLEDGQLTSEQCRLLEGLVEHQASGLVFLPGYQGRQHTLIETALGDLYPVALDPVQRAGWGSRTPSAIALTEAGRKSLLTKLADSAAANAIVWDGLPGFHWCAPALRAKAGCEVLAVHGDLANEFGRLPLLVTRTYGAGKVLFMGTDGDWRWRKGVEDLYHYRFWGQVVRWMAYARNMAKGETMRFYYSPDQPLVRRSVLLRANVMGQGGEPLAGGDVTARVTPPSARARTVRFTPEGDEWGAYSANYVAEEPGRHEVVLFCRETQAELAAHFFVHGGDVEPIGRPARPEVLEELARITGGEAVALAGAERLLARIAALPEPPPRTHRIPLWCDPVLAGCLILLLAGFWVGRKAVGLL